MNERLFDVTAYGGYDPTPKEKRKERKTLGIEHAVEPREEGWMLIRQRQGLLPFFHLIASTNPLGGVATHCALAGSVVPTDIDEMIRCPSCEAKRLEMEDEK